MIAKNELYAVITVIFKKSVDKNNFWGLKIHKKQRI